MIKLFLSVKKIRCGGLFRISVFLFGFMEFYMFLISCLLYESITRTATDVFKERKKKEEFGMVTCKKKKILIIKIRCDNVEA